MIPAIPGYATGRNLQHPAIAWSTDRGVSFLNSEMPSVEVTRRIVGKVMSLETATRRQMDVRPIAQSVNDHHDNEDSMHSIMCPVLLVAQCFALCPVQGITARKVQCLRFTWCSLRVLYSLVVILSMFMAICFTLVWYMHKGINFNSSGTLVFYVTGMLCCVLFLRLARRWPRLLLLWQQVERNQAHYGNCKKMKLKILIMMTTVLLVAFVEFILGHAHYAIMVSRCASDSQDGLKLYFLARYPQIFQVVKYNLWAATFSAVVNLVGAFYWSFVDLFIMTVSLILVSRFRLLNRHLRHVMAKEMPEGFWRESREDYNSLSYLTKMLDQSISGIVLLSFATNLFYVCQQLFNSMKNPVDEVATTYFYVSFGYLLMRTIAVSLCAANVYDESKKIKYVLYAVPPSDYRVEVHRFLIQVLTDDIAITGLNFFPVTRTLLLTLAGTVVTYEIVLVQFGSPNDTTFANLTIICKTILGYP